MQGRTPSLEDARVTGRAPRRTRRLIAIAALAVAGAAFVWASKPSARLPPYEVTTSGDTRSREATEREPVAIVRGRGDAFAMVLRPMSDVKGPLAARAFLVHDDQSRAWPGEVDVDATGTVRLGGSTDAIFAAPGEWDVAVCVGRPGEVPDDAAQVARHVDLRSPGERNKWQLVVRRVRVSAAR